jgi:hypothetical protein
MLNQTDRYCLLLAVSCTNALLLSLLGIILGALLVLVLLAEGAVRCGAVRTR